MIRSADTAARGIMIEMKVAIMTDIRICMRYCMNAVSAPTCISPVSTRCAPNHRTATVEALRISMTVGKIIACRRPTRSAVSVSVRFESPNRSVSAFSRTNARTTRMPDSCSRRTRLTWSMRSCMSRNCGTMRETIRLIEMTSAGTHTTSSHDRPTSSCNAMITPATHMIGAAMNIVAIMTTSI